MAHRRVQKRWQVRVYASEEKRAMDEVGTDQKGTRRVACNCYGTVQIQKRHRLQEIREEDTKHGLLVEVR